MGTKPTGKRRPSGSCAIGCARCSGQGTMQQRSHAHARAYLRRPARSVWEAGPCCPRPRPTTPMSTSAHSAVSGTRYHHASRHAMDSLSRYPKHIHTLGPHLFAMDVCTHLRLAPSHAGWVQAARPCTAFQRPDLPSARCCPWPSGIPKHIPQAARSAAAAAAAAPQRGRDVI